MTARNRAYSHILGVLHPRIMYIVGIDGGGTRTVGILTTETGEHLAQVESGPSNYHVVGEAETRAILANVNRFYPFLFGNGRLGTCRG